ncbi:MAG: hypothetical protein V4712_17635 [Pseudomonadota bacterium]
MPDLSCMTQLDLWLLSKTLNVMEEIANRMDTEGLPVTFDLTPGKPLSMTGPVYMRASRIMALDVRRDDALSRLQAELAREEADPLGGMPEILFPADPAPEPDQWIDPEIPAGQPAEVAVATDAVKEVPIEAVGAIAATGEGPALEPVSVAVAGAADTPPEIPDRSAHAAAGPDGDAAPEATGPHGGGEADVAPAAEPLPDTPDTLRTGALDEDERKQIMAWTDEGLDRPTIAARLNRRVQAVALFLTNQDLSRGVAAEKAARVQPPAAAPSTPLSRHLAALPATSEWTRDEDIELLELLAKGFKSGEIAIDIKRDVPAIKRRSDQLLQFDPVLKRPNFHPAPVLAALKA